MQVSQRVSRLTYIAYPIYHPEQEVSQFAAQTQQDSLQNSKTPKEKTATQKANEIQQKTELTAIRPPNGRPSEKRTH